MATQATVARTNPETGQPERKAVNVGDSAAMAGGWRLETKAPTQVQRPGTYGSSDWRGLQALKDSAAGLIDILNNKNKDLTESQNYFDTAYRNTSPFGGPQDASMPVNSMVTSNKNFRELSPSDQASIISSRQAAALSGLNTVKDERSTREKIYGTGVDNLTKMYELQQKEIQDEKQNARQKSADDRADLAAGLAYIDSKGQVVRGLPPEDPNFFEGSDWNTYLGTIKGGSVTQSFNTPVSYFKDGRKTHGGYDIAAPMYSTIYSPVSGKVVEETGIDSGWGKSVVIEDSKGNKWRLGHFDSKIVNKGDVVTAGKAIGWLGNTGKVMKGDGKTPTPEELAAGRGAHLHIEAQDPSGKLIDIGSKFVPSITTRNKLKETALISLSSRLKMLNDPDLAFTPEELKLKTPDDIAQLEAFAKQKVDQSPGEVVISKLDPAIKLRMLGSLGPKFGGETGIATLLDKFVEPGAYVGEKMNNYLYDDKGNIRIKGVTQADIDQLWADFEDLTSK